MTENTPQAYTPTPWVSTNRNQIWVDGSAALSSPRIGSPPSVLKILNANEVVRQLPREQEEGNAALIVASVNSYAKHFGANAIQCAEDDLLGQALVALRACCSAHGLTVEQATDDVSPEDWETQARSIFLRLDQNGGE